MRITRFRAGGNTYFFPDATELNHNFGDVVPRTSRLPGANGGYDDLGDEAAPGEIGNFSIGFWLFASGLADMRTAMDAARAMKGWGAGRLWLDPMDGGEQRWTRARVNSINIPWHAKKTPHKQVYVKADFQCSDPVWYGLGTEAPIWGSFNWGDGSVWGGSAPTVAASGLSTDIPITRVGTATSQPRVRFMPGASQSITNPIVQVLVNGEVTDQVQYTGTVAANSILEINARQASVTLDGANAYTTGFTFLDNAWLQLPPGESVVRVKFANAGDAASVRVLYFEGYS